MKREMLNERRRRWREVNMDVWKTDMNVIRETVRVVKEEIEKNPSSYNKYYSSVQAASGGIGQTAIKEKENERSRKWRTNNPELVKEKQAKYRANHHEEIKERARKLYAQNAEHIRTRKKLWANANPEKVKAIKIKTRSIIANRKLAHCLDAPFPPFAGPWPLSSGEPTRQPFFK